MNAWNNTALWGQSNLRLGQNLVVQGYLTQRIVSDTGVLSVEVTAEEFITGRLNEQKRPDNVQEQITEACEETTKQVSEQEDAAS